MNRRTFLGAAAASLVAAACSSAPKAVSTTAPATPSPTPGPPATKATVELVKGGQGASDRRALRTEGAGRLLRQPDLPPGRGLGRPGRRSPRQRHWRREGPLRVQRSALRDRGARHRARTRSRDQQRLAVLRHEEGLAVPKQSVHQFRYGHVRHRGGERHQDRRSDEDDSHRVTIVGNFPLAGVPIPAARRLLGVVDGHNSRGKEVADEIVRIVVLVVGLVIAIAALGAQLANSLGRVG